MTTEPSELLDRLSQTLRHEVGPAVEDEYNRTQAFMASVILSKVAKQLALGPAHAQAERADLDQLHQQLVAPLSSAPAEVKTAAERASAAGKVDDLTPLLEAIYRWGPEGQDAAAALTLIRGALRRDIDRRMEIAT